LNVKYGKIWELYCKARVDLVPPTPLRRRTKWEQYGGYSKQGPGTRVEMMLAQ